MKIEYLVALMCILSFTSGLYFSYDRYDSLNDIWGYDLAMQNNWLYSTLNGKFFYSNLQTPTSMFFHHVLLITIFIMPFYYFFKNPLGLFFVVNLAIVLGGFALYKISTLFMSKKYSVLILLVFLTSPFVIGLQFSDRFEVLVIPFLLGMIYFHYKKNFKLMFLFAILSLFVKENILLAIGVFSLYGFKDKRYFLLSLVSGSYLLITLKMGFTGSSLLTLIDSNQIPYATSTFFNLWPFAAYIVPLFSPLIFMSLGDMIRIFVIPESIHVFSGNIHYFTTTITVFFASIAVTLSKLKSDRGKSALIVFFLILNITIMSVHTNEIILKKNNYTGVQNLIDLIPDDASVSASSRALPKLSNRLEVYAINYLPYQDTKVDYILYDTRPNYKRNRLDGFQENIAKHNRELIGSYETWRLLK